MGGEKTTTGTTTYETPRETQIGGAGKVRLRRSVTSCETGCRFACASSHLVSARTASRCVHDTLAITHHPQSTTESLKEACQHIGTSDQRCDKSTDTIRRSADSLSAPLRLCGRSCGAGHKASECTQQVKEACQHIGPSAQRCDAPPDQGRAGRLILSLPLPLCSSRALSLSCRVAGHKASECTQQLTGTGSGKVSQRWCERGSRLYVAHHLISSVHVSSLLAWTHAQSCIIRSRPRNR
jgi:hypothetical protein